MLWAVSSGPVFAFGGPPVAVGHVAGLLDHPPQVVFELECIQPLQLSSSDASEVSLSLVSTVARDIEKQKYVGDVLRLMICMESQTTTNSKQL